MSREFAYLMVFGKEESSAEKNFFDKHSKIFIKSQSAALVTVKIFLKY